MELQPNHQIDTFSLNAARYDVANLPDVGGIDINGLTSFMKALKSGVPVPKLITTEDILRDAQTRSTNISVTHRRLRGILERHEATIQKRWTKKSRTHRQVILLKAWPDMPTMHRPDFDAIKQPPGTKGARKEDHRSFFIWPYINQEDLLAKPKAMLLLLNSRGRRSPCDFAGFDHDMMHLGRALRTLIPASLDRNTIVLNGVNVPSEYGKLVAWDGHPDAMNWMITRKQFLTGEGLLVLEAQEKLLDFLLSCCKQILHDIPEENLTRDTFSLQPEPWLKTESETNGFDSLAVMAAEAPYRVPAQLDFARIEDLLSARTSAAEDHMWALREDPGYFANTLQEIKEHRQEMMFDSHGKPHPDRAHENIFWPRIIGNLLSEAYIPLETYSELRRQARELRALQMKYAAEISPLKDLPKEYLFAILRFRHYLYQAARGPRDQLDSYAVMASPPLRRLFVRQDNTNVTSSKSIISYKPGVKLNKVERDLLWLLCNIGEEDEPLLHKAMPLFVDELERLLATEPKAKDLISPYIARVVADLSILAQCLRQLESYHPWADGFDHAMVNHDEDIKKEFSAWTGGPLAGIMWAIPEKNLTDVVPLVVPLGDKSDGMFAYPIEKRRTRDNVHTLRQSEANLDSFWANLDVLLFRRFGNLHGAATSHLLSQPRILQRTPAWTEPTKEEKPSPITTKADVDADALSKPMSRLYYTIGLISP